MPNKNRKHEDEPVSGLSSEEAFRRIVEFVKGGATLDHFGGARIDQFWGGAAEQN